ncbi:MAG: hypothetical protein ACON5A_04490 [Candidatus Comchoanobacterales bacterium]
MKRSKKCTNITALAKSEDIQTQKKQDTIEVVEVVELVELYHNSLCDQGQKNTSVNLQGRISCQSTSTVSPNSTRTSPEETTVIQPSKIRGGVFKVISSDSEEDDIFTMDTMDTVDFTDMNRKIAHDLELLNLKSISHKKNKKENILDDDGMAQGNMMFFEDKENKPVVSDELCYRDCKPAVKQVSACQNYKPLYDISDQKIQINSIINKMIITENLNQDVCNESAPINLRLPEEGSAPLNRVESLNIANMLVVDRFTEKLLKYLNSSAVNIRFLPQVFESTQEKLENNIEHILVAEVIKTFKDVSKGYADITELERSLTQLNQEVISKLDPRSQSQLNDGSKSILNFWDPKDLIKLKLSLFSIDCTLSEFKQLHKDKLSKNHSDNSMMEAIGSVKFGINTYLPPINRKCPIKLKGLRSLNVD